MMISTGLDNLINATAIHTSIKGDELLQGFMVTRHLEAFLNGMKLMNNVPAIHKENAVDDINRIAEDLNMRVA